MVVVEVSHDLSHDLPLHDMTTSQDLAARNVLVTKDEICKVADFGLSRETVDDEYDVKKVSSGRHISCCFQIM